VSALTRIVPLALLCLGAGLAQAEGSLPGGATVKFNRLFLHEDNSSTWDVPKTEPQSIWNYFNLAHCVCSFFNYNPDTADPTFFEDTFAFEMTVENYTTPINRPIQFYTGEDCATQDTNIRNLNCTRIGELDLGTIGMTGAGIIEISIYDLMVPRTMDRPGCQPRRLSAKTWAMVDADADSTFEYSEVAAIETDTEPPPLPTNFRAVGAENAISLSWTPPPGAPDVAYYQALCATSGGAPGKSQPIPARYQTARNLCGAQQDVALMPSDIVGGNTMVDAGTLQLPQELAQLNPSYVCGEAATSTASSLRIDGLQNGVAYTVVLLAIDFYGNATGTYFTSSLVPQPATDFWEDLHDQGSGVEGGFCLLAQTYGDGNPLTRSLRAFRDDTLARTTFGRWLVDAYYGTIGGLDLGGSVVLRVVNGVLLLPLVALALLWHALTLPGLIALVALLALARSRRRRARYVGGPRMAAVTTLTALLAVVPAVAPTLASAQSPYWEDTRIADADDELALGDPRRVKWHAGLRLGPYVPGIDAQLGRPMGPYAGPYEQMFGGYSIMPVLDIERFLAYPLGQLGVGVSVGYMGKKARAWVSGTDPGDPMRERSQGDSNSFRLFPLTVSAVYRFSYLDDELGIPIVPYVRAGLGYYIWWITAPNGEFASACVGGGDDPMCERTSARGASLGFVGSVGVSIRAERIDRDAARSMRESGIEHAGFYAEYSLGKVDGFGNEKKLSLGDATWFAGVDFEF
jgi:hypothetical protein